MNAILCPRCRHENPSGARFCNACGGSLATGPALAGPRLGSPESYTPKHLAEKILTSRSAIEGERKVVTVLFCDVANSTTLADRLGPDAMHALINGFFEVALAEVHRYEGTINQFLGDGFMALFGAPLAFEDHARRAVLAALFDLYAPMAA
jgi:class 3 adenylate cyclase